MNNIQIVEIKVYTKLRDDKYGRNKNRGYRVVDLDDRENFWVSDYDAETNGLILPGTIVRLHWLGNYARFEITNLTQEQAVDMLRDF